MAKTFFKKLLLKIISFKPLEVIFFGKKYSLTLGLACLVDIHLAK